MLTRGNGFGLNRWSRFGFRDVNDTFAALDELWRDMDRWVGDWQRPVQRGFGLRALPSGWPRMTLSDRGEEYLVRAELPGVREEDLEISLQGKVLTLAAKRAVEPPEGYTAHRRERGHLEFSRTITLPDEVETDGVTAKLEDGVLELSLPKTPEVKPRQITVKSS